ncbi:transposase domain-containing protein [Nocardia salmonicida]|uniref:transposase domain-containing protein n=1 Tax=Nocardia salmonicida TaxID=53431 RepID=UPI0034018955
MRKLVDGLRFLRSWDTDWQVPTSPALCKARAHLGEEPMRELYRRVAVPLAEAGTPDAWLAGRRVMATDGGQIDVPDAADNEEAFGRGNTHATLDDPFPKVKNVGLGECGTHAIIGAEIGEVTTGERDIARGLLAGFAPGAPLSP